MICRVTSTQRPAEAVGKIGEPMRLILLFAAALGAVAGCAKLEHKPIAYTPVPSCGPTDVAMKANRKADNAATGIRYYQSSPYLLVFSDGKNGLSWQILYLPDQTKKMSAVPRSDWSKLDATLKFENGVLTDSNAIGEAAAVPKAIIAAAEQVVASLAGIAAKGGAVPGVIKDPQAEEMPVPPPLLYKIVVRGNSIQFLGGKTDVDAIYVTLVPKKGS
jgi:hypothetical protein